MLNELMAIELLLLRSRLQINPLNNSISLTRVRIHVPLLLIVLIVCSVSIANASSSLRYPSIITSNLCRSIYPSSFGVSCLIFTNKESSFSSHRATNLDVNRFPEKGHKNPFNSIHSILSIVRSLGIKIKLNKPINYEFLIKLIITTIDVILICLCKVLCRQIAKIKLTKANLIGKIATHENLFINLKVTSVTFMVVPQSALIYFYKNTRKYAFLILLRCGDVEQNPGPDEWSLLSQNCRGLKNKDKLKQLLNQLHKINNNSTKVIALQETHLEQSSLKYSWYGNFALTPSQGSKGGVITLVSDNIQIVNQIDIDCEAHVLLAEVIDTKCSMSLIIANLHSPCAHNNYKITFFKKIRDSIVQLMSNNEECGILLLGDFNTTFCSSDRMNTLRSKMEITCAEKINELLEDFNLTDCWSSYDNSMTWRHSSKMSRIDRIKWSLNGTFIKSTTADWSITTSDHAAVITTLKVPNVPRIRSRITRIDTTFTSNIELRHKFLREIDEQMSQVSETSLNPHGKLEFLKVCIRSVALDIAMNFKKECETEFNDLKTRIKFWQTALENSTEQAYTELAIRNLDESIAKRDKYLATRGKYLSERSKSKWYQEGERSTKYFLNLNKAKNNRSEMTELMIDGTCINEPGKINEYVEGFYRKLYEKGDTKSQNSPLLVDFLKELETIPILVSSKLDQPITPDELFETLKTCSDSAPGPDGIPYSLIKLTWKHFGKLLADSWTLAQNTGILAPSHTSSYLRLLPKEGKDKMVLKNWRPITLSNCDLKLITKTLSWRLAKTVTNTISPNQTAYMKDRQISDNLHIMQYSLEQSDDGMLVSLDAEKAFDSLEHWYIKEILNKIGLGNFVKIFDTLYKNQRVDIVLNGSKAGQYCIRNGVKQGDALSCILFILGIEPLLRKINSDPTIKGITINGKNMPKALAYADDIACLIKPEEYSLQQIFNHYEVLTRVSGLKLNADKTEIISKGGNSTFKAKYNGTNVMINICDRIKVNGIVLSYDFEAARKINIEKLTEMVELQLKSWCKRNLSLLGKIQIFKTFGLSQILYKLTVLHINKSEAKKLTNLIYKFIWNRKMDANKAPDRIKRKTMTGKIKSLGFGMLDFREVVEGIRLKNVIRLLNQKDSPLSKIIKDNIANSLFRLKAVHPIRPTIDSSLKLLGDIWIDCLKENDYAHDDRLRKLIGAEYVGNLIQNKFRKNKLIRRHRHDTINEILTEVSNPTPIIQKLDPRIGNFLNSLRSNQNTTISSSIDYSLFPLKGKFVEGSKVTSSLIRKLISESHEIHPKLIISKDCNAIKALGNKISTLTNSKLKSILLRCIHGDVYCRERMHRFGMVDDNTCSRCSEIETTSHLLFECQYVRNLWNQISNLTGIAVISMDQVLGIDPKHDKVTLTIHAETLRRILAIERPMIEIDCLLKSIIKNLNILEKGVTKYQTSKMLEFLDENLTYASSGAST